MGHPSPHSLFHHFTMGWYTHTKSLDPNLTEPAYVKEMLARGEDPKPLLLDECKPHCKYWKDKLSRCEEKLETVIKLNPTKTCMYPFRDYVTCVESCVQPLIHDNLTGVD